jgi:hypothetical protein
MTLVEENVPQASAGSKEGKDRVIIIVRAETCTAE